MQFVKERLNWIMQIWLPLPVWKRLDAAEDVEEPFGKDGDDLELIGFCNTIRESVEEIFDRKPDMATR